MGLKCPKCGLTYKDFRTGETFQSIKDMLWTASEDPSDWKYKRRHTVLGRWHMLKQQMWNDHVEQCEGEISRDATENNITEY